MKVTVNDNRKKIKFKDLEVGAFFLLEEDSIFGVKLADGLIEDYYNAYDYYGGDTVDLRDEDLVQEVPVTINIDGI